MGAGGEEQTGVKAMEIHTLLVKKCLFWLRHTLIQLNHCKIIQSSVENSYVFPFLHNIHCTRCEDEQEHDSLLPSEYESAGLQIEFQRSAK